MAPRRPSLLLLGVALGAFVPGALCGSSRHSLCYSCLKVPEPSQGLPQFLSMIRLDDQPIARSDSLNSTMVPLVPWMEAEQAEIFMDLVRRFWTDLEQLSNLNPETGGLHTWQVMWGCELQEDRSKGGFLHYGYDGMDFISFDKETLRWRADHPQAQKVKETWEEDPRWSQGNKDLLEKTCIDMMQECLSHQKKSLKKAEPPVGKVTLKVVDERLEVLTCQVFGFYPKEIQVTWTRDGEPCVYETLRRNVAPNSDGTYYISLSIEIDPKERDHFRCYLDHDGLWRPLVLAFKEETAIIWKILVGLGAATVLGAGIIFLSCWFWRRCRNNLYQEVTTLHLPQMLLSPSTYGIEDEMQPQTLLQTKRTSKHKASNGLKRAWSDSEIPASPLRRRKRKQHRKWKTWDVAETSPGQDQSRSNPNAEPLQPSKTKTSSSPRRKNRGNLQLTG